MTEKKYTEKEALYIVYLAALNAMLSEHLIQGGESINLEIHIRNAIDFCNEKSTEQLQEIAKNRIETCPIYQQIEQT